MHGAEADRFGAEIQPITIYSPLNDKPIRNMDFESQAGARASFVFVIISKTTNFLTTQTDKELQNELQKVLFQKKMDKSKLLFSTMIFCSS